MEIALEEAAKALGKLEVPVGCAVFYKGECIEKSHNLTNTLKNPLAHAEMICLRRVEKKYLPELEIFVTCEPCIMCMPLLIKLKIRKITFGCKNPRFGGIFLYSTSSVLPNNIEVVQEREEEAILLLQKFYTLENPNAPLEKRKNKSARAAKFLK